MSIWQIILSTAVHAPSPHNVQPWRVKIIDDSNAELYIDSTRTLPKEDVTGSFIILTMGLFLEALKILAAQNGFAFSYELFHEPDWYAPAILQTHAPTLLPFARMNLTAAAESETIYPTELFTKRRTSRVALLPREIPAEIVELLKNLAADWNQKFEVNTDATRIEKILKYNTEAVFADLNSKDYHNEIVEWFRYSDRESIAKADGLDYRCMNSPRAILWMSARMSWLMKTPVVKNLLAKVYRSQIGAVPTLGFLAGKFWRPADAIETGKLLMRFWLETARHDVYIHPFGNLVTNKHAAEKVYETTKIDNVWLVFKIGYSPEPPKSRRLPLDKILISDS